MRYHYRRQRLRLVGVLVWLLAVAALVPALARAEGSRDLNPPGEQGFRATLEWRTSVYGPSSLNLKRRTLVKVYLQQNEYLLLGSTAVGVADTPNLGDIRVYTPGAITGQIGRENIPALTAPLNDPQRAGAFRNGFSCVAQRNTLGNETRGRIATRQQEIFGPNTEDNDVPNGYRPCIYQAPVTGIYDITFIGPSGDNSDAEGRPSGRVDWDANDSNDAGGRQLTAITAWDASVRKDLNAPTEELGRSFTYYFAGFTGDNGRTTSSESYVVTKDGFVYSVDFNTDPFGFLFFANRKGFQNTDGNALYRNVLAEPTLPFTRQNQLDALQGGVELLPPEFPLFANLPAPETLTALGYPARPQPPNIGNFSFSGVVSGTLTSVGGGGTFRFTTSQPGNYAIIISRDGINFDPTNEANRVLYGDTNVPSQVVVNWDGRDNAGELFGDGEYVAEMYVQGGEVHFPFIDVENNPNGGPIIRLLNPPDRTGDGKGDCPPWNGGCRGAFYDDRGYETADGTLVGESVNGTLCPADAQNPRGFGNPPVLLTSDPQRGFDSASGQRRYGFATGGNPLSVCLPDGGFGDKKGLDIWTFYPSNVLRTPLRILSPTAATLSRFTATPTGEGVAVRWTTALERDVRGFRVYRSSTGQRADAEQVTTALLPARGRGGAGATYEWLDANAQSGASYSYWLVEETTSGKPIEHGPAHTPQRSGAGNRPILLPLIKG